MKYSDVQKVHEAGLITAEQRQKIIEHFRLKEESNKFLVIISLVGAVLVAAGIVLLIATNWGEIPRGLKIFAGLALMLGAHAAGWWLREVRQTYGKTGEALHLIGALLFLGNIALVGQIYHLVSRPANAFLLWWAGIAALPWLLRSKALHVLGLLAFGLWFGVEINQEDSLMPMHDLSQILAYSLLGLVYVGFGYVLRGSRFAAFSNVTERLGLLSFLVFAYPLTLRWFLGEQHDATDHAHWVLPSLAGLGMVLVALGARNLALSRQWRWTWGLTLAVAATLIVITLQVPHERGRPEFGDFLSPNVFAALALFSFCLVQIQVGLHECSTFHVNLGVAFIALDIITAYFGLFGTMARTGLMFVASGVFLIVFGVYLEKKRRALTGKIKTAKAGTEVRP